MTPRSKRPQQADQILKMVREHIPSAVRQVARMQPVVTMVGGGRLPPQLTDADVVLANAREMISSLWHEVEALRLIQDTRDQAPEPRDWFEDHCQRQQAFSQQAFGPGTVEQRVEGIADHIEKELREVRKAPRDLEEWIDLLLLALDGALRIPGVRARDIAIALAAKQAKNEQRTWPDWRTAKPGKAIEHVRDQSPAEKKLIADAAAAAEAFTDDELEQPCGAPCPLDAEDTCRYPARHSGSHHFHSKHCGAPKQPCACGEARP